MPPEKKTFQNDLLDRRIDEIAQKIKPAQPKALREALALAQKEVATTTETIPTPLAEAETTVKPLRTYQSDVAEAVHTKQESIVSISIAEKKRTEMRGEDYGVQKTGGNRLVIALVCLLLIGGGAFALFATLKKTDEDNKPIVIPKPESIIGTNKDSELVVGNFNEGNIQNILPSEVDKLGLSIGTLGNIRIVEKPGETVQISPQRFIALLEVDAPGGLTRSLEDFMVGAYGRETRSETFLLFRTNSFELAFGGMLAWEKTLANDLGDLFGAQGGIFKDVFIKNRDVRVVRGEDGEIKLLYSFLDSKTFVIAQSEDVFIAVLNQFNTSQVVR